MTVVIEGPVSGGEKGWPFAASILDTASLGYSEAEYIISGNATRYRDVDHSQSRRDGCWQAEPAGQAPFRTRMLVYRPVDPGKFNGSVVVTWNNVTAGHDLFNADSRELFENGFALVCVTTQRVGIVGLPPANQGLKDWDPERYGELSIPSDDYSYDIFTQAGGVVGKDHGGDIDPMAGLVVERVIAQGASQSAGRLGTYYNTIQPITHAFDAFILAIYFGRGTPLEVGDNVVNINAPTEGSAMDRLRGENLLREDSDTPVFVVNSELEAIACFPVRQADTDTLRYWESAGTCHVSQQTIRVRRQVLERDGVRSRPQPDNINAIPMTLLYDAAFYHVHNWLTNGLLPPVQPRIDFTEDGQVIRDDHGIARGGIRLPQAEVPTATNSAVPLAEDIFALLDGSSHPFDKSTLVSLYGDEASFLEQFHAAANRAVEQGVLRPRDVEALVTEAKQAWRTQTG